MFFGDQPPASQQSHICPTFIPSQNDFAGSQLTVATSLLRLAVGHSRGEASACVCMCVCVHTCITIQLLRLKVMLLEWPGESGKVTDGGGLMGGIVCH